MKQMLTWMAATMTVFTLNAQVETDQPIILTGADGNRHITGLELPVNGVDATNKDYVDAAVSGSGGGGAVLRTLGTGSLPSMMSATSASGSLNMLASINYCRNLVEGGHSDWRYPTVEEVLYILGSDDIYPTIPGIAEATYFSAYCPAGPGSGSTVGRFGFYLPNNDMFTHNVGGSETYMRARCVR